MILNFAVIKTKMTNIRTLKGIKLDRRSCPEVSKHKKPQHLNKLA